MEHEQENVHEHKNGKAVAQRDIEAENLRAAANATPAFLKFAKGVYKVDASAVPIGSEFIAHVPAWMKCVTKYSGTFERRIYHIAKGEIPPDLETLPGQTDEANWPHDKFGKQVPPWQLENMLPLENVETGEVLVFLTGSWGGSIAINALVSAYATRRTQQGLCGCPIITLDSKPMKDTGFGPQQRPHFEITGWQDEAVLAPALSLPSSASAAEETPAEKKAKRSRDVDDDIPF